MQGLPDLLFWTGDELAPNNDPFDTEHEFNSAMIRKHLESISEYRANYFIRLFKDYFRSHAPVFTHGDIQRKNIMLRKVEHAGDAESDLEYSNFEVVLINWEFAGWYPSYWEYARAVFACGNWIDDWSEWLEEAMEPFRLECAVMNVFLLEMWS